MSDQATGQVCPEFIGIDWGSGPSVNVTSVYVPGLGFEIVTDTGELFAIARDQRAAWLIAGAVNLIKHQSEKAS